MNLQNGEGDPYSFCWKMQGSVIIQGGGRGGIYTSNSKNKRVTYVQTYSRGSNSIIFDLKTKIMFICILNI